MNFLYYILFSFGYLISLLPFKILYFISDIVYFPLYYIIKYRKEIIINNLHLAYPNKSDKEITKIEKEFYHFFCDYVVETIKLISISKKKLMRHMTFSGIDSITKDMKDNDKLFCFVYLGHYGNWEWIASLPYWVDKGTLCGQIYHPLKDENYDKLFLNIRNKFGGESIPMKNTLRRIIQLKQKKQKAIIGFISDQLPKWNSIHHFSDFMGQETAVFTGTEQIGKQVGAVIYYANVKREKRGYYHCEFKQITTDPKSYPDYEITDIYMKTLEKMIDAKPCLWLWSHNRWKRTKEEWILRNKNNDSEKTDD